jgi:hypothetical protein
MAESQSMTSAEVVAKALIDRRQTTLGDKLDQGGGDALALGIQWV